MRILIFGKTGQVGRELARARWPLQAAICQLDRHDCNLENGAAIETAIDRVAPDLVINAAAYTAVDRAESEPDTAARVNRDAPIAMARACAKRGATLIHLSTDYVFDGMKSSPYVEDDATAPLSVYGRTKAEGESGIRDTNTSHLILRTSWVFASHGANFVRTVLRLAGERAEIRIVADQRGTPTAARDIAEAITSIAGAIANGHVAAGTYHFTSTELTTWHGFAQAIVDEARLTTKVAPITSAEYPTAARRPANSALACDRIEKEYGIVQPCWRHSLAIAVSELAALQSEGASA